MNTSDASSLSDTKIFTIFSTSVNLLLSLPINSYIAWLIATGSGGTLEAELLPLNLAVFEILFCLLSIVRFLKMIFTSVDLLSHFAKAFLWSGRPVFQCCICVEQFLAVVHPVLFLRYKPLRYKVALSVLAWVAIIGLSLFYTFLYSIYYLCYVGECVVLILVMLFCYFSVLVALKRPGPGRGGKGRGSTVKGRAFLTILVITVSFLGTYFFWCVIIISSLNSWSSHDRKLLTRISTTLTFASGFIQPLLHLRKAGKLWCLKGN
ncbi:hypothetical protein Q5P01_026400 [Channa striata]|uniref:G-protein coupled receptors family 1 profile domain-containing protein n=1 Tax=Channa striata TaxID=64152 RepID=A0AA88IK52_CHASR|nr:hypothetical protein Q5P01_026400 [Channa striata]